MRTLIRDNVRIDLECIGEGWDGDYDASDPNDEPLLRFDVYMQHPDEGWVAVSDGSYCTALPDVLTSRQRELVLTTLMDRFHHELYGEAIDPYSGYPDGRSIRSTAQELSWFNLDDVKRLEKKGL